MELPADVTAECEVRFLNAKGIKPIEIHRQLTEVYDEWCMDVKNVGKWCREFAAGCTEIHDEERSGRPLISDEPVAKVEQILYENRRITLDDLRILVPEVSRSTIHRVLREKLQYRKSVQDGSHECSQKTINGDPPYSPDLAPSDYYLFPKLKNIWPERDSATTTLLKMRSNAPSTNWR
ncbi:uncharacterized protein LOC115231436 [Octopus sinensis]|uniref:Uncharacterized protein LOC115231436 n=1 Tax=Octopus sinensis TaxID=2607531 RepID=A0A6P7U7G7_9MOLL|nr:uncharacterized protein LOC115231436 [Octopus sinensis]